MVGQEGCLLLTKSSSQKRKPDYFVPSVNKEIIMISVYYLISVSEQIGLFII